MPAVEVTGVPSFVDAERLLGDGAWKPEDGAWVAELTREQAADLGARLRGIVLGGSRVEVRVAPPLKRPLVRAARTEDARRRRDITPGFTRPGVRLDEEGRIGLTPEALALALGERAAGRRVADACCGCGGNAIGFARAGCDVVAIEPDAQRLEMAKHNASVFGASGRITFVRGRAEDVLPTLDVDLVFADPPWAELTVLDPILASTRVEVWVKVPPSFDPAAVTGATTEAWFGRAQGDRRRVKFLLLTRSGRPS